MAKLFQEIHRHRKVRFDLTFLVMDPGYNQENRALIEGNARVLGIPVTIFESRIFDVVDKIEKNPCYSGFSPGSRPRSWQYCTY